MLFEDYNNVRISKNQGAVYRRPDGETQTVVGCATSKFNRSITVIECSKCAKDPEMFGKGWFTPLKGNSVSGYVLGCGCSSNRVWTEKQTHLRMERLAEKRGHSFIGFSGPFEGIKTLCKFECKVHGEWKTKVDSFLNTKGQGCLQCSTEASKERFTLDDAHFRASFIKAGYDERCSFERCGHDSSRWRYTCPVCSHDEYVKAGLCSGVFEYFSGHMAAGYKTCRCGPASKLTEEQAVFWINKQIRERKIPLSFESWVGEFKGQKKSKFFYNCKKHGRGSIGLDDFKYGSVACRGCAHQSQQQAYIHLVEGGWAIKFGIAKDYKKRLNKLNQSNILQLTPLCLFDFPNVISCKNAESHVKKMLICGVVKRKEMDQGWSETTSSQNIEKVMEIFEDFGGIRDYDALS